MLKKFVIISSKEDLTTHFDEIEVLLNTDHIISLKPIRIFIQEKMLDGFWIRMTNGKKYKATKVPQELIEELLHGPVGTFVLPKGSMPMFDEDLNFQ